MGSFADIKINGHELVDWKNTYYEWYFSKSERKREIAKDLGNDEARDFIGYRTTAGVIRRRLQLDGYDHSSLERDFNDTRELWIKDMKEMHLSYEEAFARKDDKIYKKLMENIANQLEVVQKTTLDEWKSNIHKALSIKPDYILDTYNEYVVKIDGEPLLSLMISTLTGVYDEHLGFAGSMFPCMQMESYALVLLDICEDDDICELDITDIVHGGWVDDFEDIAEAQAGETKFHEHFRKSIDDLIELNKGKRNPVLQRMIFSSVITTMEAYLSDTMKKNVLNRHAIKRRFVGSLDKFIKNKIQASTVFSFMDSLDQKITEEIDSISFHNVDVVTGLYKNVLLCKFPEDKVSDLKKYVELRHDIVHRNGKSKDGTVTNISKKDIEELINLVSDVVSHIDKQILDGLLDTVSE
ncbi:HEPN/Toprim-associated domain-containing protein [Aeromonas hydrophila]|uniref:HEPN/Toprim-associated domain-containing protein n=1 Tax=Aeromonas hydrophila TaxID=644 RepID=UPI00030E80CF|nr:HEPN/Toprim-associated domain-containing protein [Aeromonas hydrophila]